MNDMNLSEILFLDLEPLDSDNDQMRIREIGVVLGDFQMKSSSPSSLLKQLEPFPSVYLCGHNLRDFDVNYLERTSLNTLTKHLPIIDTLELSLLFFSEATHHKLPKPYKNNDSYRVSDPLEDSILTK